MLFRTGWVDRVAGIVGRFGVGSLYFLLDCAFVVFDKIVVQCGFFILRFEV